MEERGLILAQDAGPQSLLCDLYEEFLDWPRLIDSVHPETELSSQLAELVEEDIDRFFGLVEVAGLVGQAGGAAEPGKAGLFQLDEHYIVIRESGEKLVEPDSYLRCALRLIEAGLLQISGWDLAPPLSQPQE